MVGNVLTSRQADTLFVLSPTQTTPLSSHPQGVQTNQVAFCWSGSKVFVTTAEGRTRILGYPSFEPLLFSEGSDGGGKGAEFSLAGHTSSCLTAELQPTARYLATGGSDSVVALWDTADWLCARTLTKMTGPVKSLSMFFFPFLFPFYHFFIFIFIFSFIFYFCPFTFGGAFAFLPLPPSFSACWSPPPLISSSFGFFCVLCGILFMRPSNATFSFPFQTRPV